VEKTLLICGSGTHWLLYTEQPCTVILSEMEECSKQILSDKVSEHELKKRVEEVGMIPRFVFQTDQSDNDKDWECMMTAVGSLTRQRERGVGERVQQHMLSAFTNDMFYSEQRNKRNGVVYKRFLFHKEEKRNIFQQFEHNLEWHAHIIRQEKKQSFSTKKNEKMKK
jgi:hypothetical protein